ncbi:HAAS signaling domain-containing protein [Actinomadura sp. 6N118]|uniref:HAAS signaling domain-containing protein n=1 Tax=Actinomadura sp. 6N118 TaxID=3375151 RepID=UPI0037A19AE3
MSSPIERQEEIGQYAEDVRAALADIPEADRAELLEDLEGHLAEVAAESDEPLVNRLGTPAAYATELRSAYGTGTVRTRRSVRASATGSFQSMETRFREKVDGSRVLSAVWAFLKEFRSLWWIVRAWAAAVLLWRYWDDDWHADPWGAAQWTTLAAFVVASIALGQWSRARPDRSPRVLIVGLNGLALLLLFSIQVNLGLTQLASGNISQMGVGEARPSTATAPQSSVWEVANLFPYSKDGKPLKDILLYDQDGRPVQLDYEAHGYQLDRCGSPPPIANSYPLPLRQDDPNMEPSPSPSCVPGSPMPAPKPSGDPTATPTPTPSSTPTPTPTR